MKKSMLFFAMIAILSLAACRKKHKDVEVEFFPGAGAYCGHQVWPDGTEFCPTEIRVVSSGERFVFDHPLDTAITNKHDWWNKTYIATIEEQKSVCECEDGWTEPQPGYEPHLYKKPIVKIKKIKLKE